MENKKVKASSGQGNPYERGRVTTVDLHVITCSNQLLLSLINRTIFIFSKNKLFIKEVMGSVLSLLLG